MASNRLSGFVTTHVAGAQPASTKPEPPVDAERLALVKSRSVHIRRLNAANSAQQRGRSHGDQKSRAGQKPQHDGFDSELEDTTIASVATSHVIVKDSQVDEHVRPTNHPMNRPHQLVVEDEYDEHGEHGSDQEGEDYDEAEQQEEDVETYDYPEDSQALRKFNAYVSQSNLAGQQVNASVFDLRQDGDSYPPTTSGNISQKGEDDLQYGSAAFNQKPHGTVFRKPEPPMQKHAHANHTVSAPVQAASPIPRRAVAPQTMRPTTPQGAVPTHGRNYASYPSLPNRPATTTAAYTRPVPNPAGTIHQYGQQPFTGLQSTHRVSSSGAHSIATIVPQAAGQQPVAASLLHTPLEIDLNELYNIPFEKLHQQSLVEKPAQSQDLLSDEDAVKPLAEQLKLVRKMDKESKATFLASLTLEQWEEAGDWFITQFGALVKSLTTARKERRKREAGFGEEILARHQIVQNKKRTIDATLEAMGRSGQGVLRAGTPKKARIS